MEQSLNLVWVLLGAFLVMFMQVGFALVETGFTRAKHAVNTMGMNLVIYPVGALGFWLVGYVFLVTMAFTAVPTPLYVLYESRDHLGSLMVTVIGILSRRAMATRASAVRTPSSVPAF